MYKNKRVNVVMPVYNEERTVGKMVGRVLGQHFVDILIIVNDGSTDNTVSEVKRFSHDKRVKIIDFKENRGKGYAVRAGIDNVKDGIIIIQDADEEYHPEDYADLLGSLTEKTPVFGHRTKNLRHKYILGSWAAGVHNILFNSLYGQNVKDMNAGYKVFDKDMLKGVKLHENGFEIDPEIAIALARNGYEIKDVPIRYSGRTFKEGKKIGARDAIGIALFLIKKRFVS
jgi:glycosyltransferase involved in cell wall biosynthesis